jgi:transcriptional regulator with XRE-family HTH domain
MSENRDELRRFLKDRRARLSPTDVGLQGGRRRRVPGLRREEVALLAGIGVSWYTTLENGDVRGVSDATLHAIAGALRLDASERQYLMGLAGRPGAVELPTAPDALLVATLHALTFPAYIITPTWKAVACNAALKRVWSIDESEIPFNAFERLFLDPRARAMHGTRFIANITPVIAMLRSSYGRQPQSETLRDLRDRVLANDDVRDIWDTYEIRSPLLTNTATIDSPAGTLTYEVLTLPAPDNSHAIVVHVPDVPSRERLALLR